MLLAQIGRQALIGGIGSALIFLCGLVGFTICTMIFAIFAAHYFLVTIIHSTSGHDEVHFPNDERIATWWWKPLLCLWILFVWIVPGALIIFPALFHSMQTFLISWGILLWFAFPLGVISSLYTRNWFFYMHPTILGRMLTHFVAFVYVQIVTSVVVGIPVALLYAMLTQSYWWGVPAAFAIPTAILFYARQWGRFAWLSLHFVPNGVGEGASDPEPDFPRGTPIYVDSEEPPAPQPAQYDAGANEDELPHDEPPAPVSEPEDEWADTKPYGLVSDPEAMSFDETPTAPGSVPMPPAPLKSPTLVAEEEEDEWSLEKKPYDTTEHATRDYEEIPEADRPQDVADYYEKRAEKERIAKEEAKRKAEENFMPERSTKRPTFAVALFTGVLDFMIEGRTLQVWANLFIMTALDLVFVFIMAMFWKG